MNTAGDLLHVVTADNISYQRRRFGKLIVWGSAALMFFVAGLQTADQNGWIDLGSKHGGQPFMPIFSGEFAFAQVRSLHVANMGNVPFLYCLPRFLLCRWWFFHCYLG